MPAPLAVIAAGGTGGHMFPAQALAETLIGRGWKVRLTTACVPNQRCWCPRPESNAYQM